MVKYLNFHISSFALVAWTRVIWMNLITTSSTALTVFVLIKSTPNESIEPNSITPWGPAESSRKRELGSTGLVRKWYMKQASKCRVICEKLQVQSSNL